MQGTRLRGEMAASPGGAQWRPPVQSVTRLSEAASCAPPSPELCLIAALVITMAAGKPKKVSALVASMRAFADGHREMAGVIRIRGGEYDEDVLSCMAQAAAWLERMEPFLVMMAKR